MASPFFNKDTAFTQRERERLGLDGLLPPVVETIEEQLMRAYEAYQLYDTDLGRHIYLRALQDRNEVLFYRLLLEHIREMLPVVHTPTVGLACQRFSHIYRRPRGLFVSYPMRDDIPRLLKNRPNHEVDVIAVTDGERILGIGDQGVGGLGISIGKLSLDTLVGGIHPARTLPIVLDVGTNNPERLNDPEYLGWRHERVGGQEYLDFVDRFVQAVTAELPDVFLQWEDLSAQNARPILERYRDQLLTFNDDIQGMPAAALGAILAAVRVTGRPLSQQCFVFLGAGPEAIGLADYLCKEIRKDGVSAGDARGCFWFLDVGGLLHNGREGLRPEQCTFTRPEDSLAGWPRNSSGVIGLAEVVRQITPTVLVGMSTVSVGFREVVVREMARKVHRPIILPLSDPTAPSEARAEELIRWTDGRALIVTASPSESVRYAGRSFPIAQCSSTFIFPAVILGVIASRAMRVSDAMMLAAARALAELSPAASDPNAPLLPGIDRVREVVLEIAIAVGLEAQRTGLAPATTPEAMRTLVMETQWHPTYCTRD